MRVEIPTISISWADVTPDEKAGEPVRTPKTRPVSESELKNNQPIEQQPLPVSVMSSSGTYSPASLKAAADYHAKYLTVAENNVNATQLPQRIPQALLDQLQGIEAKR